MITPPFHLPTGETTVHFVKAGMVVASQTHRSTLGGLTAYVNVDHLKTDLTGSQFRDQRKLDIFIRWVNATGRTLVDSGTRSLNKLKDEPQLGVVLKKTGIGVALFCAFLIIYILLGVYEAYQAWTTYTLTPNPFGRLISIPISFIAMHFTLLYHQLDTRNKTY